MGLIVRLSRIVPLLIILAVIAAVIYLFVSYTRSPARAKEVLIKVFTVLCSVISAAFLVVTLYALLDGNMAVVDLAACFLAVGLIGLGVTQLCRYIFMKHNPHYREKAQKARILRRWPWQRRK